MTAKGDTVKFNMLYVVCIKNLKLENIQFVVDSFYLKKWKDIFKQNFLGTTGLRICMDLRIFGSFLYPTLLKICNVLLGVQSFHVLKTVQKC